MKYIPNRKGREEQLHQEMENSKFKSYRLSQALEETMPFLWRSPNQKRGQQYQNNLTYLTEVLDFQIFILHFEITFKGQNK